jgi:uncharacterized membrane protein
LVLLAGWSLCALFGMFILLISHRLVVLAPVLLNLAGLAEFDRYPFMLLDLAFRPQAA